jgi:hypothetical protein
MRNRLFLFLFLFLFLPEVPAQDEPPPAKGGGVRITFLPPPMDGTLSLGLYKSGKLIRVLHAEATAEKDFTVGLNGLITHWDGKDDAGNPAPAGKYSARGYCVGALEVEGVAYHGNDWMTDDASPHIREISELAMTPDDELLATGKLADGATVTLHISQDGTAKVETGGAPTEVGEPPKSASTGEQRLAVRDGKIVAAGETTAPASATDLQNPAASAPGVGGSLWVIDQTSEGTEVKQFSAKGEFLRRLAAAPGDPVPRRIAASKTKDFIALLETTPAVQRVRALALEGAPAAGGDGAQLSTWKTLFSKTIYPGATFAAVADKLGRDKPFVPEDKIRVRLLPNPLFKDAMHDLDVRMAVDAKGSSLVALDGLPLCRITETPRLLWAVMGHDGPTKAVTIFQGDGAVVEEFRAHKLANMMAFDAGEYEWTGK